jgi:hypothetical protein
LESAEELPGSSRGEILKGWEWRSKEVILLGKLEVFESGGVSRGSEPNLEKVGVEVSFKVAFTFHASKSIKLSLDCSYAVSDG